MKIYNKLLKIHSKQQFYSQPKSALDFKFYCFKLLFIILVLKNSLEDPKEEEDESDEDEGAKKDTVFICYDFLETATSEKFLYDHINSKYLHKGR